MNKTRNDLNLPIQFQMQLDDMSLTGELKGEAERRLLDLFDTYHDLAGAELSITVLEENPGQTHKYQVEFVLYAGRAGCSEKG